MNFGEWVRFFLLNDNSSDLLGKYGEDLTPQQREIKRAEIIRERFN